MCLSWEIDNCLRTYLWIGIVYYKHFAHVEHLSQAGITIDPIILRESLAELQSNSFSHHAHGVDGINQRLGVTL